MTCPYCSKPKRDPPLPDLEIPDPITIFDLHYIGLKRSDVEIYAANEGSYLYYGNKKLRSATRKWKLRR